MLCLEQIYSQDVDIIAVGEELAVNNILKAAPLPLECLMHWWEGVENQRPVIIISVVEILPGFILTIQNNTCINSYGCIVHADFWGEMLERAELRARNNRNEYLTFRMACYIYSGIMQTLVGVF